MVPLESSSSWRIYGTLSQWEDIYSANMLGLSLCSHPEKGEDTQPREFGEWAVPTQHTLLPFSQAVSAHRSFHMSTDAAL